MKKIPRREVSNRRMIEGNENKYSIVILEGELKEWVGIGWIDIGPATNEDRKKYPTVKDS
jgi:hypothetical protein